VVDDGSSDRTREVSSNNKTQVISQDRSLGKGAAMKTGANQANGEVIVFIDGDGAHDPKDIPRIAGIILKGEADLVIGSRALLEHKVSVSPVMRRISNNLSSFTISAIISFILPVVSLFRYPIKWIRITDCTSGFRAIRSKTWQNLNLLSNGFEIETEMIYELVRNRLAIVEVPIECNWDSRFSRLSITRDGLKTLKLMIRKLVSDIGGRRKIV
jgi:glycosyltransferase involved in cell wall biosynthesis